MHTHRRVGRTVTVLATMLILFATACGGGDKAGGPDRADGVVLTLAGNRPYLPAELAQFPADVERLSGGSLRIELTRDSPGDQPDQQHRLIVDVQAGHA